MQHTKVSYPFYEKESIQEIYGRPLYQKIERNKRMMGVEPTSSAWKAEIIAVI